MTVLVSRQRYSTYILYSSTRVQEICAETSTRRAFPPPFTLVYFFLRHYEVLRVQTEAEEQLPVVSQKLKKWGTDSLSNFENGPLSRIYIDKNFFCVPAACCTVLEYCTVLDYCTEDRLLEYTRVPYSSTVVRQVQYEWSVVGTSSR